jgi:hypothetical protein
LPPPDLSGYRHTYPPPPSIAALTFPMDKTPKRQERVRPPTYSSLGRGKQEGRQRLSIELGPEAIDNIERLCQMHGEITNTQVIKLALAGHPACSDVDERAGAFAERTERLIGGRDRN